MQITIRDLSKSFAKVSQLIKSDSSFDRRSAKESNLFAKGPPNVGSENLEIGWQEEFHCGI
ncbi:MAG: hypothetical protein COT74_00250 [Bdellovibrionales bacterium CG10_big_fil_rev_8_21_14_0_10_45_34]|nr:MAG: hypothetical protein COT74_00250 [Bdellovibrionales bacterium CG10_big_fil_rev_8_21_14_0_10_45_34]